MPVVADSERNFITGLSDFWTVFFKDTANIRTYFDSVQISLGQIYLELLQTVLGTSLKHTPLFSKQYFKLFIVRERDLSFIEGENSSLNRFSFTPIGDLVQDVPSLMNKVVDPTKVLLKAVDFEIIDNTIQFTRNIFNIDGHGQSEPQFPVRIIQEVYPSEYLDPLKTPWTSLQVHTGDTLRFTLGSSTAVDIRIAGFDQGVLLLDQDLPELHTALNARSWGISILRTPHDSQRVGELVPNHPRAVHTFTDVVPQSGTTTVSSTHAAIDWVGQYLYLYDLGDNPTNNGFYKILSVVAGVSVTLDRSFSFIDQSALGTEAHLVDFGADLGPSPVVSLPNNFIDLFSLELTGRRLFSRTVEHITYLAGEEIIEGVDYQFDDLTGKIAILSIWDPLQAARATYTWRLEVASVKYQFRKDVNQGEWTSGTSYQIGDLITVTVGSTVTPYVCKTAHTAGGSFDSAEAFKFSLFIEPFSFNNAHSMREIPFWGADVLLDKEILFNNFGYLLAFKKPSSENYRSFLRGVSQLFLLGPMLERFESALNVMAGYPVIRDDGELLISYDDGITASGTDGEFIDSAEGKDGTLTFNVSGSTFSTPTGNFFPSDVGAIIHVRNGVTFDSYVITSVVSSTLVKVSPDPTVDGVYLQWSFVHNVFSRKFRVTGSSYAFSQDDVNGILIIKNANNQKNVGSFRIVAVENVTTVVLESTYGFNDETNVSWQLTRTQVQVIQTSRDRYEIPILTPIHDSIIAPGAVGTLIFQSFDTLTSAFTVEDYIRNPTWWHDISIPTELLQLETDVAGRRRVTPQLIEHIYNSLDQAAYGDFGLAYDRDDEGSEGLKREGEITWFGGNYVKFEVDVEQGLDGTIAAPSNVFTSTSAHFKPSDVGAALHLQIEDLVLDDVVITAVLNTNSASITSTSLPVSSSSSVQWRYAHKASPQPRPRDVGQHLVVYDRGSRTEILGYFKVLGIQNDGVTLNLDRFPPPELERASTPLRLFAKLPPLIYRRTVAFIIMDRFLKYHSFRIKIDKNTPLTTEFISEITLLMKEAKASYTFVYLEPVTSFSDKIVIHEEVDLTIKPTMMDRIVAVDNQLVFSTEGRVRYNDYYRYHSGFTAINLNINTPQTISPPSPPLSGTYRSYFLFGRFALSLVMSNGKRPVEGTDYTFDYDTGILQIPVGSTLVGTGGGTGTFFVVAVHMRQRNVGDPIDPYETGLVYNGTDPTIRIAATQDPFVEGGLVDRALQINIT